MAVQSRYPPLSACLPATEQFFDEVLFNFRQPELATVLKVIKIKQCIKSVFMENLDLVCIFN